MTRPFIVGVTGYARSGKDTFAQALVEHLGFKRFAFADPIKRDLIALDPIIFQGEPLRRLSDVLRACGGDLEVLKAHPTCGPEWRRLCQRYGTEVWRAVDPDIWVKRTLDAIKKDAAGNDLPYYVVTDVRFPNELELMPWAATVRIERPGVGAVNDHVSERYIGDLDVNGVVVNGGTVEDLHAEAVKWTLEWINFWKGLRSG